MDLDLDLEEVLFKESKQNAFWFSSNSTSSNNLRFKMDLDDELSITPSFKSKNRRDKGKGKVIQPESAPAQSPAASDDHLQESDNEEANSSAVMFKKKSAKSRGSGGIGASSSAKKGSETASRSKLALSFGADQDDAYNLDTDDADTSIQESAVRRADASSSRKLKRPPAVMAPSSNANYDVASRLSSTLSQTSITAAPASRPTYSKDYLEELKASTAAAPAALKQVSTNGNTSNGYDSLTMSKFGNNMLAEGAKSPACA
jgi:hypothetical protein